MSTLMQRYLISLMFILFIWTINACKHAPKQFKVFICKILEVEMVVIMCWYDLSQVLVGWWMTCFPLKEIRVQFPYMTTCIFYLHEYSWIGDIIFNMTFTIKYSFHDLFFLNNKNSSFFLKSQLWKLTSMLK
jgi:hypothetical protein